MPGTTTAPSLCAEPGRASTVTPEIRPEPSTLNTTSRAQPSASSAFSAKNSMGAPTSSGHERLSRVNCIYNNAMPKTTTPTPQPQGGTGLEAGSPLDQCADRDHGFHR